MAYSMRYVAPGGRSYEFLDGGDGAPFIEIDTVEGLVGLFEDTAVQVVGETGARVDLRDRIVQRLEGSFTVVVFDREQWHVLMRDFSTRVAGTLFLDVDGSVFELRVKLAAALPFPTVVPAGGARIPVSVIADTGVWELPGSGEDSVTVTNSGDTWVWPEIVWNGAGGSVSLPSGAVFRLPSVAVEYRLPLRRSASGRAVNASGGVVRVDDAVGELVPVGESRRFGVPSGARLEWRQGVFNPWSYRSGAST